MKRVLLSLAVLFSATSYAQNDLSITLNQPVANSTVGPGIQLSFDVSISNNGTQAVTTNDTVLYYPTLNGNLLVVSQNGQNVPIVFSITGTTMNNGDTENRSVNFAGLNISNASAMSVDFCGGVIAIGPNWSGVTESDTTNNLDCATLNYDPNGGNVGLVENVLFAGAAPSVIDGSYSDGMTYFVHLYNMTEASATISFVDLTGRAILSRNVESHGREIAAEISLSKLPKGVALAVVTVNGQRINAKKVIVK